MVALALINLGVSLLNQNIRKKGTRSIERLPGSFNKGFFKGLGFGATGLFSKEICFCVYYDIRT